MLREQISVAIEPMNYQADSASAMAMAMAMAVAGELAGLLAVSDSVKKNTGKHWRR